MNIYLDIDGVLISKDGVQSNYVFELLEYTISHHNVFWLTTHCRTGENNTANYLHGKFDNKTFVLIKKIKPANWQTLKTEALDFDNKFLWLDDYIMEAEKNILEKNNCTNNFILIDLKKEPDQLFQIINLIKNKNYETNL